MVGIEQEYTERSVILGGDLSIIMATGPLINRVAKSRRSRQLERLGNSYWDREPSSQIWDLDVVNDFWELVGPEFCNLCKLLLPQVASLLGIRLPSEVVVQLVMGEVNEGEGDLWAPDGMIYASYRVDRFWRERAAHFMRKPGDGCYEHLFVPETVHGLSPERYYTTRIFHEVVHGLTLYPIVRCVREVLKEVFSSIWERPLYPPHFPDDLYVDTLTDVQCFGAIYPEVSGPMATVVEGIADFIVYEVCKRNGWLVLPVQTRGLMIDTSNCFIRFMVQLKKMFQSSKDPDLLVKYYEELLRTPLYLFPSGYFYPRVFWERIIEAEGDFNRIIKICSDWIIALANTGDVRKNGYPAADYGTDFFNSPVTPECGGFTCLASATLAR